MSTQKVLESGKEAPSPIRVKAHVARTLLTALSKECKAYCVLSGYDRLPEDFDTDIDFMVNQEDFERMPRIIAEVGRQTHTRLFQSVDHELTGRAYFSRIDLGTIAHDRSTRLRFRLPSLRPAMAFRGGSPVRAAPASQRVLDSLGGPRIRVLPYQEA